MDSIRWAAIGVIVFVLVVAIAAFLIEYSADAFDRAPVYSFVHLADADRNSPGRVHWVAGESRTFTASVADLPSPALVVVGDDLRLVPDGEEATAALCNEPVAAVSIEDGQELTVYACSVAVEATIRLQKAADAQAYGTFRFQVHGAIDPIPPPTPPGRLQSPGRVGGVAAERVSDTTIALSWETPGDRGEFVAYEIRRRQAGGGWTWTTAIGAEPFRARLLDEDGIEPGVVYEYQVRALGSISHGGWSEVAAASLETPGPPTAVVVSEDASTDASDLSVTWSAPVAGMTPTQYGIERSVEHGPWVTIHLSVASSAVRYVENAAPGAHYCYRVWSGNDHGTSAREPLGGACITVPTPTPVPEPTPEGG